MSASLADFFLVSTDIRQFCLSLLSSPTLSWEDFGKAHAGLINRLGAVDPDFAAADPRGRELRNINDALLKWAADWRRCQPKADQAARDRFEVTLNELLTRQQHAMRWEETPKSTHTPSPQMNGHRGKAQKQEKASAQMLQAILEGEGRSGATPAAVESFLRRYRDKYPDCCVNPDTRRKNEPKYLYRPSEVLPALREHFPVGGQKPNLTDE
jgi:hypothetical protein